MNKQFLSTEYLLIIRASGSGYTIYSHKGKKLSKKYRSREAAKKRLRQIEYFKRHKIIRRRSK